MNTSCEQINQRGISPSSFKGFLNSYEKWKYPLFSSKNTGVCFQASLTVDSHLSIAMFLQQELNMRAGWRDILRTGSDSCTQPISLVEQKRETAHRGPGWGGGEKQRRVRNKSLLQPSWETTNKTLWLWLVFLFIIHAVTLVDVSCCCSQKYKLIWLQQQ